MPGIQFTFEVNDTVSGAIEGIKSKIEGAFDQQETLAKFNAGLGQSKEVTAQMGEMAKTVFREGWGSSLEDVTDALSGVGAQVLDLGTATPEQINFATKAALDLAEVMGTDVSDVTRAAGQLMKNGLATSATQAFNIIANGATSGANRSGDLLDVLDEYGPAFHALGMNGADVLDVLNGGLNAGAFNADKAADAINEFGIRAIDGSKGTTAAFQSLGLDAEKMSQQIAGGGPAAHVAMIQIMEALGNMTDPVAQEAAGVALFGSMWEDMGKDAILALRSTDKPLGDMGDGVVEMGKTLHDTAKNKVEKMQRSFDGWINSLVESDGPLGDVMTWAQSFGPEVLTVGSQVGIAAMAISNMGIASKVAAGFQWLLNAAMSANPIMLIVTVIALLVGAFVWLWNTSEGFREFWIGLWENAQAVVGAAVDWVVQRWNDFTAWWSQMLTGVSNWWNSTWDGVKSFFNGIADWLNQRATAVRDFFVNTWTSLRDGVVGVFTNVRDWIGDRIAAIKQFATDVRDWFVQRWSDIYTAFATVWNGISTAVSNVATFISRVVSTVFGWVRDRINDLVSFIESLPRRISNGIADIKNAIATGSGLTMSIRPNGLLPAGFTGPRMAAGGIATGPTLALIGEGRESEAVLPLSKLDAMLSGGTGGGVTVNVYGSVIHERDLARTVQEAVAKARRSGAIPAGGF